MIIYIGTLHKFATVLQQYLNNVKISQIYQAAECRSRASSLIHNQKRETIENKLKCQTVFTLIHSTLDETAKKLAIEICQKLSVNQRLHDIVWKLPLNEAFSNMELQELMRKNVWNQIVPILKVMRNNIPMQVFEMFCFESHRSMLEGIKLIITPSPDQCMHDLLSFIQVLRAKYAFQSILKYMVECWSLSEAEVHQMQHVHFIEQLVQWLLSDIEILKEAVAKEKENKDHNAELLNAIKLVIRSRQQNVKKRKSSTSDSNLLQ